MVLVEYIFDVFIRCCHLIESCTKYNAVVPVWGRDNYPEIKFDIFSCKPWENQDVEFCIDVEVKNSQAIIENSNNLKDKFTLKPVHHMVSSMKNRIMPRA